MHGNFDAHTLSVCFSTDLNGPLPPDTTNAMTKQSTLTLNLLTVFLILVLPKIISDNRVGAHKTQAVLALVQGVRGNANVTVLKVEV